MNYKRINTVFAKALIAGKSGLFEIFLLICTERLELPVVQNYLTLLYIYMIVIVICELLLYLHPILGDSAICLSLP